MADVAAQYELQTGAGNIVFNSGTLGDGSDKYWLSGVQGLDGPAIRAPVDLVPYGNGGRIYTFREGPRRVVMDGMLLIESSRSQALCMELRNDLVTDLLAALDDTIQNGGSLTWTPAGQSPLTLAVFCDVGLSINYSDNYAVANFSFGLVSDAADPS